MDLKQIYEYCKKELEDAKKNCFSIFINESEFDPFIPGDKLLTLLDFRLIQELAERMKLTPDELTSFGGEWMLYEWNKILDEVEADEDMRTLPEFDIAMKRLRREKTTMLVLCLFTIRATQVEDLELKLRGRKRKND